MSNFHTELKTACAMSLEKQKGQGDKDFSAVFYVDGGLGPDGGSYGVCGFIHNNIEGLHTVDEQYATKKDKYDSKFGKDDGERVIPLAEFSLWGYGDELVTNNSAEITAMYLALDTIKELNVKTAVIRADSMYVLNLLSYKDQYRKNNYRTSTGKDLKNLDLVKSLFNLHDEVAKSATINLAWVAGHSGDYGNTKADNLATTGKNLKSRHVKDNTVEPFLMRWTIKGLVETVNKITDEPPVTKPAKEELKNIAKMFTEKYLLFTTNVEDIYHDTYFQYSLGSKAANKSTDPKKKAEGINKKKQLIGKPFSDSCVSVVHLKEIDPLITHIKSKARNELKDTGIIETDLNMLTRAKVYTEFLEHKFNNVTTDVVRNRFKMQDANETVITSLLYPPRLAWTLIESFNSLTNVLYELEKNPDSNIIDLSIDITDRIYQEVETKKGKVLELIDSELSYFDVPVEFNGTIPYKSDVRVKFGIDLPNEACMKRLKGLNPKVKLITWGADTVGFRFATTIETDEGYGIWCSVYSNLQII